MRDLLSNPSALLLLCCIGGIVVGSYSMLFSLLRDSRRSTAETSKWAQAMGGGRDIRRRQQADLDALRQAVARLQADQGTPPDKSDHG